MASPTRCGRSVSGAVATLEGLRPGGNFRALLIASLPPIALIIIGLAGILIGFARTRRIDSVSILALVGIILSLLALVLGVAGGGDAATSEVMERFATHISCAKKRRTD